MQGGPEGPPFFLLAIAAESLRNPRRWLTLHGPPATCGIPPRHETAAAREASLRRLSFCASSCRSAALKASRTAVRTLGFT